MSCGFHLYNRRPNALPDPLPNGLHWCFDGIKEHWMQLYFDPLEAWNAGQSFLFCLPVFLHGKSSVSSSVASWLQGQNSSNPSTPKACYCFQSISVNVEVFFSHIYSFLIDYSQANSGFSIWRLVIYTVFLIKKKIKNLFIYWNFLM